MNTANESFWINQAILLLSIVILTLLVASIVSGFIFNNSVHETQLEIKGQMYNVENQLAACSGVM